MTREQESSGLLWETCPIPNRGCASALQCRSVILPSPDRLLSLTNIDSRNRERPILRHSNFAGLGTSPVRRHPVLLSPTLGDFKRHRLQTGVGLLQLCQHFDIQPVHHDSWQVAAEYTTPSARQSLPRQEPDLRVLLYQNQKELSVWQATTESCRATPSREQPPSQGHDPPTCQSSPMSCRPSGGGCTCWLFPAGTPTAQP